MPKNPPENIGKEREKGSASPMFPINPPEKLNYSLRFVIV